VHGIYEMNDGNGLKYLLTDQLGSVVAITDSTGTLISQQRYLPFGQVRTDVASPNAPATDLAFTGQRNLDAQGNVSLGLMDYNARMYDPWLGRFIQPDTIISNESIPQSWNRYSYVQNDPIGLTDPTGHHCPDEDMNGLCPEDPGYDRESGGSNSGSDTEYNFRGYSDAQLISYFQTQGKDSTGCGPYSIAMAANLFNSSYGKRTNFLGGDIQNDLEKKGRKPSILGIPLGIPTWWGFASDLQSYVKGNVTKYRSATVSDLKHAILDNHLPIVAVSWQTDIDIASTLTTHKPTPVGHYLVAVGFNDMSVSFLDPGMSQTEGSSRLQTYTNEQLDNMWNGTSNSAIEPGAMFVISP